MTINAMPAASQPIVQKDAQGNILSGTLDSIWYVYFLSLATGDQGNSWTPTVTGLTATGTPTITGNYYQNQGFTDFWVRIVPGTDITGTSGTTYIDLPFPVTQDAPCFAVAGNTGGNQVGMVNSSTLRAYPPAFTAVTVPLTITGRVVSI